MSVETAGPTVLGAAVNWMDGYGNWPRITLLLDRELSYGPYSKRSVPENPGWYLYVRSDGPFVSFFAWNGKPDRGFGGWARDVELDDGSTEHVVGGWSSNGDIVAQVGHDPVVELAYRTDLLNLGKRGQVLDGGTATALTEPVFREVVAELLPDCEVVPAKYARWTVKWRGQLSKEEFMERESARTGELRDALKAKYGDGYGKNSWWEKATDAERAAVTTAPYSELKPRGVVTP